MIPKRPPGEGAEPLPDLLPEPEPLPLADKLPTVCGGIVVRAHGVLSVRSPHFLVEMLKYSNSIPPVYTVVELESEPGYGPEWLGSGIIDVPKGKPLPAADASCKNHIMGFFNLRVFIKE